MRRPRWFAVLLGACALVACGGSSASSTPAFLTASPPPTTADAPPTGTPSPAGAVACLPVDTPVDEAPAAIAKVWRDRDVNIVPSCSVFDVRLPAFVNLAKSAGLSDADAMKIAEARIRSEEIANWGLRSGQLAAADELTATTVYSKPALAAVHAGFSVVSNPQAPGCSSPNRIAVVQIPAETVAGMDRTDPAVAAAPFGVVVQYGPGDCTEVGVKGSETTVVVPNDPSQLEYVLGGLVRHDDAVGIDYWYYVASGKCGSNVVVSQICALAGY